jgi:hypothetical protein
MVNSDAGFCTNSGLASIGVVVRDSAGKVLLAAWRILQHCSSPEETEVEAGLQGLRLVSEWVKQPTCFEADCLTLTKALTACQEPRSGWAGIIGETQGVMRLLPECTVRHVRCQANQVAHLLAQRALQSRECVVMRLSTPECVRRQVDIEACVGGSDPQVCNSAD